MNGMMNKIETRDVNFWYGDFHALKGISMDIAEKSVVAFIGPSGCGKSTFLRLLNRMNDLIPDTRLTGEILIDGQDIYKKGVQVDELRKNVGMVFQRPNPFPKSIFENVAYGLRVNGVTDNAFIRRRVEETLKGAALWDEVKDKLKVSAYALSGGQQQRLCIARAMAVSPSVLLMDEPASALDPISTAKVEELIHELKKQYTIVIVTHNMQQAARVSDSTAFFYMGEMVEFGHFLHLFGFDDLCVCLLCLYNDFRGCKRLAQLCHFLTQQGHFVCRTDFTAHVERLFSCGNRKTKMDPFATITEMVDSAGHEADTLQQAEVKEEPEPLEADELFDDFIFNYASDEALQRARTEFPLPYYNRDTPSKIEERFWKHDYLFTKQNYYTLLFDRESDMDMVGDTALKSVQVEWIYLKTRMVKKYYFERKQGMWMLEAINLRHIEDGEGENFVDFYTRFVTDSLYQSEHIANPLQFVTIDPDDEFAILETTLDVNQWYAFRPSLPADKLSNINYGQKNEDNSNTKILKVNGIGNGYSNVFYFRRRGGEWKMYKYEDTSI